MSESKMRPVTVLYILGAARSGSSLLTSLLGEMNSVFAAAEMRLLWRGFNERLCGCGARVGECQVWRPVIDSARCASALERPEEMVELQERTTRTRHLTRLVLAGGLPKSKDSARYLKTMTEMYKRLGKETGAAVIVDSSKSGAEAALLHDSEGLDVKIVHLVRDPRAVVYSWRRVGHRNPASRRSTGAAISTWLVSNGAAELAALKYCPGNKMRLRYEDYVADPIGVLADVAKLLGLPPGSTAALSDHSRPRASIHMVGGNRLRFEQAVLTPRFDAEWLEKLPAAHANAVTVATVPWLLRYGYPLRAPSSPQKGLPSA